MNIKVNFKKQVLSKSNTNLILFADEKFNISGLKKHISSTEYSYISDILKKKDTKKKIVTFDISSKKKNNFSFTQKKSY
jgi:leucyl aminopeptidase